MKNITKAFFAGYLIAASGVALSQQSDSPSLAPTEAKDERVLTEEEREAQRFMEWAETFEASLTYQTGKISLPGGKARLNVPENYYYLSPQDTKKVLEDAWGNPESELTLGMLFPSQYSVFDRASWGVTIEYVEDGYVSDEDAGEIDYDDLLAEMKNDTQATSEWRVQQGFEPIELVGWAEPPYYDGNSHKLYWAKELKFGDNQTNTLNYNVRVLGRQGFLVLNFIASMEQFGEVNSARDQVLAMAEFSRGHKYSEFNPDIDEVAAYGIGGLIAGKVLAKTGFLAVALLFLKKFWFVLFIPLVWLKGKLFRKKEQA